MKKYILQSLSDGLQKEVTSDIIGTYHEVGDKIILFYKSGQSDNWDYSVRPSIYDLFLGSDNYSKASDLIVREKDYLEQIRNCASEKSNFEKAEQDIKDLEKEAPETLVRDDDGGIHTSDIIQKDDTHYCDDVTKYETYEIMSAEEDEEDEEE